VIKKANTGNENIGNIKKDEWTGKAEGNSTGSKIFVWIITRFGLWPAYSMLVFASIQYVILDKKAKSAIKMFRRNLGLSSGIVHYFRHFYSFGMALIDRFFFLYSTRDYFEYRSINEELIRSEAQQGRGVILLGAHVGNWEIAGNLLQDRINTKVNFLMFDAESEKVKNAVGKIMKNRNVGIIYINQDSPDTMVEVVNALRRGEIVCMHGDRILGSMRSEQIRFLGREASFPIGAFAIASISGASVIPFFAIKSGFFHYTFSAFGPVRVDEGDRASRMGRIRQALEMYVRIVEEMVKQHPYQWYNFYNFWGIELTK
jgi:predicted LPLAT superfamily acyltransferase